jgi:hypothetical protein
MDQKPSIGRVVHYVLKEGRSAGCHRAALIVNAFGDGIPHANLHIHLDGANDAGNEFEISQKIEGEGGEVLERLECPLLGHAYSAPYDPEGKLLGSWHWPERV